MNTQARGFPSGDMRTSDADRDRALAELSEHFQTGRLTQEEFEERSGRALGAKTGADLEALFADLPLNAASATAAAPWTPLDSPVTGPESWHPAFGGRRERRFAVLCVVAACVVADIVVSALSGHHSLGWLVPVLVVVFIVRRMARR